MTLNCNYYMDKSGSWPRRRECIGELFEKFSPDIVALQAVKKDESLYEGKDQAQQLAELGGFNECWFEPCDDNQCDEGLAVLSRSKIEEKNVLELNPLPENNEDPAPRIVQKAQFAFNSHRFCLFNGYFSWVKEQARHNIEESLLFFHTFNGPALFTGDLNTPANTDVLQPLKDTGWSDVWKELKENEPGATYASPNPQIRIDYAFANRDLNPHIESINIIGNEPSTEGVYPSDHFGLLVRLSL